jgi:hypothetical protein
MLSVQNYLRQVAEDGTGSKLTEREEEVKGHGERGGCFFRPMPALNFLIHKYKSRKKQVMIILRESRKVTRILTQQHCGALGYVRAGHSVRYSDIL